MYKKIVFKYWHSVTFSTEKSVSGGAKWHPVSNFFEKIQIVMLKDKSYICQKKKSNLNFGAHCENEASE